MTVDVLIPVYKPTDWVFEAINSVLEQTYESWNLIIVDDFTPLPSKIISKISDLSLEDDKILYHRFSRNIRAANARNKGVTFGTGEFIAFLDQDDLWHPEKLEKTVKYFKENKNIDLLHTNIMGLDPHGNVLSEMFEQENLTRTQIKYEKMDNLELSKEIFNYYSLRLGTIVVRRKAFEKIKGFDGSLFGGEDLEFAVRSAANFKIGHINERLSYRRIHLDNVTKTHRKQRKIGRLKAILKLKHNHPFLGDIAFEKFKSLLVSTIKLELRNNNRTSALNLSFILFKICPTEFQSYALLSMSFIGFNHYAFVFYHKWLCYD